MKFTELLAAWVVCLTVIATVTADDQSDASYWRIRTRAKLSINRARQLPTLELTVDIPDQTAKTATPDPVTVYTIPGCVPCVPVWEDDKKKLFPFPIRKWDITEREPPIDVTTVPAFHWRGASGKSYVYPPPGLPANQRGYPGAKRLVEMWQATQNPL